MEMSTLPANDPHQRFTIIVIRSAHCGWTELRATLDTMPFISVAEATTDPAYAVQLVARLRPHLIISAERFGEDSAMPHLETIQAQSPQSRFLIIAAHLDSMQVVESARIKVAGYLLWQDLSTDVIRLIIESMLVEPLVLVSRDVADAYVAKQHSASSSGSTMIAIREREHRLLQLLLEGTTHEQIARLEGLSRRTVERMITDLESKLGAPSLFALGCRAEEMGLLK